MTSDRVVDCATHGQVPPAYVCHHLAASLSEGGQPGVNWLRDDEGHANAWCDSCDAYLEENGGEWNDSTEAFAKIQLICERCFERLTKMNPTRDLN